MKPKNESKQEIKDGLIYGLIYGLIFGLIFGLIYGLTITFTTQLIALITQHSEFVMNDLISSGLLLIVIQVIGWLILKKMQK